MKNKISQIRTKLLKIIFEKQHKIFEEFKKVNTKSKNRFV